MNLPFPQHPGYTLEDWKQWDGRWELIHGMAYDMTPVPSTEHQQINMVLASRIFTVLEGTKGTGGADCRISAAPTGVFLESGVVQPDLLIVCDPA